MAKAKTKSAEGKGKPKDWRKTKAYKDVRTEIYTSLGGERIMDPLTASRVDEYMDFWVLRHQLQDDISARGLYVEDDRGRSMENRSMSLAIQTSRQMAAIAATLSLTTGNERTEEDDEL